MKLKRQWRRDVDNDWTTGRRQGAHAKGADIALCGVGRARWWAWIPGTVYDGGDAPTLLKAKRTAEAWLDAQKGKKK